LFAAVLHLAHGRIIPNMPLDVVIAYAAALKEAGAERVDIYTTQSAWPDKIPTTSPNTTLWSHISASAGRGLVGQPLFL
jgi:hypothetical protein